MENGKATFKEVVTKDNPCPNLSPPAVDERSKQSPTENGETITGKGDVSSSSATTKVNNSAGKDQTKEQGEASQPEGNQVFSQDVSKVVLTKETLESNNQTPFVTQEELKAALDNVELSLISDDLLVEELKQEEYTEEELKEYLNVEEPQSIHEDEECSDNSFHTINTNSTIIKKMETMDVKNDEMSTSGSSKRKCEGKQDDTASSSMKRTKKPKV